MQDAPHRALTTSPEVPCPCCLGAGTVASDADTRHCPLCEGFKTMPEEIAERFLGVATRRLPDGNGG